MAPVQDSTDRPRSNNSTRATRAATPSRATPTISRTANTLTSDMAPSLELHGVSIGRRAQKRRTGPASTQRDRTALGQEPVGSGLRSTVVTVT